MKPSAMVPFSLDREVTAERGKGSVHGDRGVGLGPPNLRLALSVGLRVPCSRGLGTDLELHGGKRERNSVCVHYSPSLHGWLLQASLEGRGDERILYRGENRAGRLGSGLFGAPRGQPSPSHSRVGGRNLFIQEVKGGSVGRRRGRLSWLGTQTWGPDPQCETSPMYLPHLARGVGLEVQCTGRVPGK